MAVRSFCRGQAPSYTLPPESGDDGQFIHFLDGQAQWGTKVGSMTFIRVKGDLPSPIGGVITLEDAATYFFLAVVDLEGDRLVCGDTTTILGSSSENCRIKSTGLVGTALITSDYTLPMRFITIEADLALDLDGSRGGASNPAIDWNGVNFTDCGSIGVIKDYDNFIYINGACLNSGDMLFDGTIATIGVDGSLFVPAANTPAIQIKASCTVTRRFRMIYSSVVALGFQASSGIDVVSASSIAEAESFILDTVNFSGGGVYLPGVGSTSNASLFKNCVGISNTAVTGQMYMQANATPTTVTDTTSYFKVAGTTSVTAFSTRWTHTDNRLTCDAVISRRFIIQVTVSFSTSANNVCYFAIYSSVNGSIITESAIKTTANAGGRSEGVALFALENIDEGDYIELHCRNSTGTNAITVEELNFLVTEI